MDNFDLYGLDIEDDEDLYPELAEFDDEVDLPTEDPWLLDEDY